ncbi:MAG: selenide, water dikinase SelD, partial [Myxococcales bacterium]|nr:selenide, water dikinase SelD [Myxococcales bacterium]
AELASGRQLGFDLVSLDCGIEPDTRALLTGRETVTPVKPIATFIARWRGLEQRFRALRRGSLVVVGGGAAGIELAIAAAERLLPLGGNVTLIEAGSHVLPATTAQAQRFAERALSQCGVRLVASTRIVERGSGVVISQRGESFAADEVLWASAASAPGWLARCSLDLDADGYVRVTPALQSPTAANVFAAGDAATVIGAPRPKAGVFAVRQGPLLARNLRAAARGDRLASWRPQREALALIAISAAQALAVRGAWCAVGPAWMRLKRWIDERFVASYRDLGAMPASRIAGPIRVRPRALTAVVPDLPCGGCGAKLGADLLARALARLPAQARRGVLAGIDAADDAAVLEPTVRPLVVTVDGFRAPVSDVGLFARLAVNHALSDAFAMGATPIGVLALVTVEHAVDALKERDLEQVLLGAAAALQAAAQQPLAIPLLGGHSAEGAELSLGFTVLAQVDGERWFAKGGLVAGQSLILTRALGSGALLAAAMRGQARSAWLSAALSTMIVPLRGAAGVFARCGAHGVTDVTGFGLLGHLAEMARASRVAVEVDVAGVPAYDGALDCLARGVASQLEPNNALVLRDFDLGGLHVSDPRLRLLVDPQTCGGLLAGVDEGEAAACVLALRAAGDARACIVGHVRARPPGAPIGRLLRRRPGREGGQR